MKHFSKTKTLAETSNSWGVTCIYQESDISHDDYKKYTQHRFKITNKYFTFSNYLNKYIFKTNFFFPGLVNVYSSPVVASQPWRLPKEKRRRKRVVKSTKMKESSEGQNYLPHQLEETSDSTTKESSSGGSKPTEKTASSTLPTSSVSMKSVV